MEAIITAAEEVDINAFIPNVPNNKEGIYNHFTDERVEEMREALNPIRKALINLDAESYLSLSRIRNGGDNDQDDATAPPGGERSDDNISIHNQIIPQHPGIRYLHIAEKAGRYSIGIFVFPPNAVIPLHNHPGMTVLSRILYGTVTVRTYDIIEPFVENTAEGKAEGEGNDGDGTSKSWIPKFMSRVWNPTTSSYLATYPATTETIASANFKPTDNIMNQRRIPRGSMHVYENSLKELSSSQISISELYPTKGNVHEFTAGKHGAAVLDVLVPPYDVDNDRDCTFYREDLDLAVPQRPPLTSTHPTHPTHEEDGANGIIQFDTTRKRKWLVPIPQPDWFHCISGRYGEIGE